MHKDSFYWSLTRAGIDVFLIVFEVFEGIWPRKSLEKPLPFSGGGNQGKQVTFEDFQGKIPPKQIRTTGKKHKVQVAYVLPRHPGEGAHPNTFTTKQTPKPFLKECLLIAHSLSGGGGW